MDNNKVPANVFRLGIVSLLNDVAGEIITPLLPIYLTSVLGAPAIIIGLIEGLSDSISNLSRYSIGLLSDKLHKRKIFVTLGYSLSALSKFLISFATTWPLVLLFRFTDRLGKGIRSPTRDALILQSSNGHNKGLLFGIHRTLDSTGSIIGPIVSLLLIQIFSTDYKNIFLFSSIFAFIGVGLLATLVKEKTNIPSPNYRINIKFKDNRKFKYFFIGSMIFSIGCSTEAFLILQAKNLGFSVNLTILAYILFNIFQAFFSTPAGKYSDRIGSLKVFTIGVLVFFFTYLTIGISDTPAVLWVMFPVYGIYKALTECTAKSHISSIVPAQEVASYLGMYQTGIALATLIASIIGGLIWQTVNPQATFLFGATTSLISLIFFSKNIFTYPQRLRLLLRWNR